MISIMKYLAIASYLLFNLLSSSASSQDTDSIASIGWMVGKWSVEAGEVDSDDSAFKESGFLECTRVLNNRIIRCERYVTRSEMRGRYTNLSKSRSSIYYFIYNKNASQFDLIRIGPNGTRTTSYRKEDQWTLKANSSFDHPTLGFKMFNDISLTRESDDLMIRVESLKNSDGTFTERYEAKMRRIE